MLLELFHDSPSVDLVLCDCGHFGALIEGHDDNFIDVGSGNVPHPPYAVISRLWKMAMPFFNPMHTTVYWYVPIGELVHV